VARVSSLLLQDRSAVVTGASRGIGRAIAAALVAHGARVFMLARGGEALTAAAESLGPLATPHRCDIADATAVARAVDAIRSALHGGAPDILVNNAGLFPLGALDTMSVDDFAQTIDLNLVAPFRLLRAFLPAMRARHSGHIVTIGSIADRHIFPGNGAYSASKYGQRAMQEVLAAELKGTGVRRTLVSPAATDTPIWDPIDPDNQPGFPTRASMLRAEDVADAVLWAVTRPAHVNVDELRVSSS
jgi:NADP-dependent 3-hydroxy acid dehydrogenase YdfG